MKHLKLFEDFSNDSLSAGEIRAIELVILFTLKQLLPDGGNNPYGEEIDWQKLDPIFPSGGPDLYISFDSDDAKEIIKELNILYNILDGAAYYSAHRIFVTDWRIAASNKKISQGAESKMNKAAEIFKEYGLQLESLTPDENIVNLNLPGFGVNLSKKDLKFIVDFYKTREQKIRDLEQKYKTALTSKKFGL